MKRLMIAFLLVIFSASAVCAGGVDAWTNPPSKKDPDRHPDIYSYETDPWVRGSKYAKPIGWPRKGWKHWVWKLWVDDILELNGDWHTEESRRRNMIRDMKEGR